MELSGFNFKKFLIFSQKKAFVIFWESEIPKKFLLVQEAGLPKPQKPKFLIFLQKKF